LVVDGVLALFYATKAMNNYEQDFLRILSAATFSVLSVVSV